MRSTFFSSDTKEALWLENGAFQAKHLSLFNSTQVDLTDCNFEGYFEDPFIKTLQESKKLDICILAQNRINERSIADLAMILEKNISLTQLDLSNNQLGSEGAEIVLDAIVTNSHSQLSKLDLSNNNIDSIATDTIKKFMKTNTSLHTLILDNNALNTPAGNDLTLSNLFESLAKNKTLQYISLKNTQIKDNDIKSLMNGLKNNKTLLEIDLSYSMTRVNPDRIIALINLLKTREPKCILKLGKLSYESFNMIQSTCESNKELVVAQFDSLPRRSSSRTLK